MRREQNALGQAPALEESLRRCHCTSPTSRGGRHPLHQPIGPIMMDSLLNHRRGEETLRRPHWRDFSADDLIEAYEEGTKKGRDELTAVIEEKLESNLSAAAEASERLFGYLQENTEVSPIRVYLRMESAIDCRALFLVPEEQYVSDAMTEVLKEAKGRELELAQETFSIEFSFLAYDEETTDEDAIIADGFRFTYPDGDRDE